MKNKITVEDHIGWKINSGSCSFWWDDWLGVGALANYTTYVSSLKMLLLHIFSQMENGMKGK